MLLLPIHATHQVHIDAYKKMVLMKTILDKPLQFPMHQRLQSILKFPLGEESQDVTTQLREVDLYGFMPYQAVINAYSQQNEEALTKFINEPKDGFNKELTADGNMGLCQVLL